MSRPPLQKVAASLLCVLLVSCSATRHISPSSPEELSRLVLVIKELPDGTVTHSWQRAEEFDLSQYRFLARAHRPPRSIVTVAAGWNRDCQELERLRPQEFTAVDPATDWLKRNRKEILVGSVIVIAGVAFIAVSAGVGIVILAPALLLALPGNQAEPVVAQGAP